MAPVGRHFGIQAVQDLVPDLPPRQMRVDMEIALADQLLVNLVDRSGFGRELKRAFDDILNGCAHVTTWSGSVADAG